MSAAAVLLALALLAAAGPSAVRVRAGLRCARSARGATGAQRTACGRVKPGRVRGLLGGRHGSADRGRRDRRVGTPRLARLLRRTADLLTLGADPAAAWSPPPDLSGASLDIHTQALLRLAGGQRVRVPRSPTASLNSPDNAAAMPRTPPRRPPSAPRC
ncbi:hypothetical protein I553_2994 [Mycobacterium xenopi 4042]|uniref:Uncharacterized protein n=1 Tax=Mycobacterium xenopi 4042 TaxID=1299334 RepID=X8EFD9_MYCXE|nr:hypothetical protein I553_2994 [Mycobacterium xenopi 4042]